MSDEGEGCERGLASSGISPRPVCQMSGAAVGKVNAILRVLFSTLPSARVGHRSRRATCRGHASRARSGKVGRSYTGRRRRRNSVSRDDGGVTGTAARIPSSRGHPRRFFWADVDEPCSRKRTPKRLGRMQREAADRTGGLGGGGGARDGVGVSALRLGILHLILCFFTQSMRSGVRCISSRLAAGG